MLGEVPRAIARRGHRPSEPGGEDRMILPERVREESVKWVGTRPITFAEFLDLDGHEGHVELVDGVVKERMAAQLDHEKLLLWIDRVLGMYVEERGLGMVLGSR